MATGIKQLLISPDGGTFTLGNGDASLEFPPGAVEKNIHVRYAIILHGPFVFPAGFKPGSVVVYINMDGATLVKPVQLFLSHWCIREETDNKETMKFVRAPHSIESGKKEYAFEELEEEADFTEVNSGVFSPHVCGKVQYKIPKQRPVMPTSSCRFKEAECECPGLYLLWVCMYMCACIIHPHVYLVYMLAICFFYSFTYNSLVSSICFFRFSHLCAPRPLSHSSENSWLVSCIHTYIHIYYAICLYCISNCNFVFAPWLCSWSRLHPPLPHLCPFQMPKHLLAHHKQK